MCKLPIKRWGLVKFAVSVSGRAQEVRLEFSHAAYERASRLISTLLHLGYVALLETLQDSYAGLEDSKPELLKF